MVFPFFFFFFFFGGGEVGVFDLPLILQYSLRSSSEEEKRGLISRTAAGNRGYCLFRYTKILKNILICSVTSEIIIKTNIRENLKYCSNYEFLKLKLRTLAPRWTDWVVCGL